MNLGQGRVWTKVSKAIYIYIIKYKHPEKFFKKIGGTVSGAFFVNFVQEHLG